jgi:hypothetical protein
MDHQFDFGDMVEDNTVYVKLINRNELPKEVQGEVPSEGDLFGVHRPDGEQLAIVPSRALAFVVARQNDFSPVSVH